MEKNKIKTEDNFQIILQFKNFVKVNKGFTATI